MLIKDKDFKKVEREVCKLIEFNPSAIVENGKIKNAGLSKPYATLVVECRTSEKNMTWAITNKADFIHLWEAIKVRGVKENEEALVIWSIKKNVAVGKFFYKYLHKALPKLTIW